jgi:hypothetical protein
MSRQLTVKYTPRTLALINACQAAEAIPGAAVVLTQDAASKITRQLPPREFQLFDIQNAGPKTFTITLK